MRNKLSLYSIVLTICLLGCVQNTVGQRISDVRFISPGSDEPLTAMAETSVCSEPDEFSRVAAVLSPGNALPNGNEYVLELSDADGSFDDPVEIARVDGPNNGSSGALVIDFTEVIIPPETAGDGYRVRVITTETDDEAISDAIPIYFFRNDLDLRLNNRDGVIELCDVGDFPFELTIEILDRDNGEVVSPDDFEFEWFRGSFPFADETDALIAGVTGPTFTVNASELGPDGRATFYARIKLGVCNAEFIFANTNNQSFQLIDGMNVFIEDGPTFSFCPGDMATLVASDPGTNVDYQWLKDGEEIDGEIGPTYTIPNDNFEGEYEVTLFFNNCNTTSPPVTVLNEGSSITSPLTENLIILPGETITLEITTDAPLAPAATSNFVWFRDGSPQISGSLTEPTISFDVNFPSVGEYMVVVNAADDCAADGTSTLTSFSNIFEAISIEMTIVTSEENDCENDTVSIELEEILGIPSPGPLVPASIPLTEEQLELFDFEWYQDGNPTGVTDTILEISTSDQGAIYELRATLRATGQEIEPSNQLSIVPIPADIEISVLNEDFPITLSVIQNPNYTYEWVRVVDGEEIVIVGETGNTIEVSEEGEYRVIISSGICVRTPSVVIGPPIAETAIIPNIVTPNNDNINDNWLLPAELFNQQNVEVTIYDSTGREDFSVTAYQNNWPSENSLSLGQDAVYYYIITRNSAVVRKGSITIMR